jgi:hypothetical protein
VISTDLKSFLSCAAELFPGATIRLAGNFIEEDNWSDKILYLLSTNPKLPPTLTTDELGKMLNVRWREISSNVLSAGFRKAIEAIGWLYVSGKGRKGSRFDRIDRGFTQAALRTEVSRRRPEEDLRRPKCSKFPYTPLLMGFDRIQPSRGAEVT